MLPLGGHHVLHLQRSLLLLQLRRRRLLGVEGVRGRTRGLIRGRRGGGGGVVRRRLRL